MYRLSLGVLDLTPDLAPDRCHLTEDERRVLAEWTGELLLARALIPGGSIGDLAVLVYPRMLPARRRWVTVERACPVVLFSLRLLQEISRSDSVLSWAAIGKNCGCGRGARCSHFAGAQVAFRGWDRTVIYDLIHDPPVNVDKKVNSDAIAGRRAR